MQSILRLEILKARRTSRAQALLILLTLGPMLMTIAVPFSTLLSSKLLTAMLGGLVPAVFALSLVANGFVFWPMALMLLIADLWSGEAAERTLRTLVLTQAHRRDVLGARLIVTTGIALLSWIIFGTLLLADLAATRAILAARVPEFAARFPISLHRVAMALGIFTVPLTLGFLALALFFTITSLLASSVVGVLINTVTVLVALWWLLPQILSTLGYSGGISDWLFTHYWASLFDKELAKSLVGGARAQIDALRNPTLGLLANLAILLPIADRLWTRKELHDA